MSSSAADRSNGFNRSSLNAARSPKRLGSVLTSLCTSPTSPQWSITKATCVPSGISMVLIAAWAPLSLAGKSTLSRLVTTTSRLRAGRRTCASNNPSAHQLLPRRSRVFSRPDGLQLWPFAEVDSGAQSVCFTEQR